jgi:hypothetical protein
VPGGAQDVTSCSLAGGTITLPVLAPPTITARPTASAIASAAAAAHQ